jgi:hypothetical protein
MTMMEGRTAEGGGEGVEYQEEEAGKNEPLFHGGLRLQSNLLDMEDEEPLFVMELTTEERD